MQEAAVDRVELTIVDASLAGGAELLLLLAVARVPKSVITATTTAKTPVIRATRTSFGGFTSPSTPPERTSTDLRLPNLRWHGPSRRAAEPSVRNPQTPQRLRVGPSGLRSSSKWSAKRRDSSMNERRRTQSWLRSTDVYTTSSDATATPHHHHVRADSACRARTEAATTVARTAKESRIAITMTSSRRGSRYSDDRHFSLHLGKNLPCVIRTSRLARSLSLKVTTRRPVAASLDSRRDPIWPSRWW
jgi:hypothetical protein